MKGITRKTIGFELPSNEETKEAKETKTNLQFIMDKLVEWQVDLKIAAGLVIIGFIIIILGLLNINQEGLQPTIEDYQTTIQVEENLCDTVYQTYEQRIAIIDAFSGAGFYVKSTAPKCLNKSFIINKLSEGQ